MTELKLGTQGDVVSKYCLAMRRRYESYALEPDGKTQLKDDRYFGSSELRVHNEWQGRMKRPIRNTGIICTAEEYDFIVNKVPFPTLPQGLGKVWLYGAAGTGGQWNQGPQHDSAEWLRGFLGVNYQGIGYPAGGFLGLMGGDPKTSYLDSIDNLYHELKRLLWLNPHLNDPGLELWFFGYSQSADGIKRAVLRLFGEDGEFAHLRGKIKGLILFGDPTRASGPTKIGNNPVGWGISRWDAPEWIDKLSWSITTHNDLYACTTDDTLVKYFYPWFIRAETELPFVVYSAKIIVPAILSFFTILGGIFGSATLPVLQGVTGLATPFLNLILGMIAQNGEDPDPELVRLLTVGGILSNLPQLVKTLVALQGIQTHGEYHLPKPEFGGRSGIQVACDIVRGAYGR